MTIETDNSPNGIIFNAFEDIYLQNKTVKVFYSLDVSIINTVWQRISKTIANCGKNVKQELKWFREFETDGFKPQTNITNEDYYMIDALKMENENLWEDLDLPNSCFRITNITRAMTGLIIKLNKMRNMDTNSILEVVPISKLVRDIKKSTNFVRRKKLTLPFEYNYWFIYNLLNHSKFSFARAGNTIQFGFEIPIYRKITLIKAYSKPTIINNIPYKYRLNTIYLSPNRVFYSESSRRNNCFQSKNMKKTFCGKSNHAELCNYNYQAHKKIEDNKCFEKLPKSNYLVQIGSNFFFTIMDPLTLNITCVNETKKEIHLTQASNILNVSGCSLQIGALNLTTTNNTDYMSYTLPLTSKRSIVAYIILICLCLGVVIYTMMLIYFLFFASIFISIDTSNTYIPSTVYNKVNK